MFVSLNLKCNTYLFLVSSYETHPFKVSSEGSLILKFDSELFPTHSVPSFQTHWIQRNTPLPLPLVPTLSPKSYSLVVHVLASNSRRPVQNLLRFMSKRRYLPHVQTLVVLSPTSPLNSGPGPIETTNVISKYQKLGPMYNLRRR